MATLDDAQRKELATQLNSLIRSNKLIQSLNSNLPAIVLTTQTFDEEAQNPTTSTRLASLLPLLTPGASWWGESLKSHHDDFKALMALRHFMRKVDACENVDELKALLKTAMVAAASASITTSSNKSLATLSRIVVTPASAVASEDHYKDLALQAKDAATSVIKSLEALPRQQAWNKAFIDLMTSIHVELVEASHLRS